MSVKSEDLWMEKSRSRNPKAHWGDGAMCYGVWTWTWTQRCPLKPLRAPREAALDWKLHWTHSDLSHVCSQYGKLSTLFIVERQIHSSWTWARYISLKCVHAINYYSTRRPVDRNSAQGTASCFDGQSKTSFYTSRRHTAVNQIPSIKTVLNSCIEKIFY